MNTEAQTPPPKIVWLASKLNDDWGEWGLTCMKKLQLSDEDYYQTITRNGELEVDGRATGTSMHEKPFDEANLKRLERLKAEDIEAQQLTVRAILALIDENEAVSENTPSIEHLVCQSVANNAAPLLSVIQVILDSLSSTPVADALFVLGEFMNRLSKALLSSNDPETAEHRMWKSVHIVNWLHFSFLRLLCHFPPQTKSFHISY